MAGRVSKRETVYPCRPNHDTDSYDILYKGGENLRHEGDQMRRNYNGWIQNRRRGINNEMRLKV